ncbi:hypothetical protein V6N13_124523 [Hibiscus sabdariffa]|uniref:Pectinesterase inhibitor domain-containing protein n=2 Tax=Hibiscus sabdariffa TaxID=183260 RepID=A0ABR1ZLR5_9ROSI
MKPLLSFLFLSFFFLRPIAAGPTAANDTDFIRASCSVTLYPHLCYSSLSGYADAIQQDPARLARIAIGVSLSKTRHIVAYVSNLTREAEYRADPRATSALRDCVLNMDDAVDEIDSSLNEMRGLVVPVSESFRFQIGNVQTWMSAALTDEETCTDGFEDVAEGPLKTAVCKRAVKVKKLTSNALALVNSYAQKGAN